MKKIAVIVAGGTGQRMGGDLPKQFLLLQEKPLIWHTLRAFTTAFDDIDIVLVCPENFQEDGKKIADNFPGTTITIVPGGATRFHSVRAGLQLVRLPAVVFVHDAVRCLVTPGLIQRCYDTALQKGNAIPVISPHDSMRLLDQGMWTVLDREKVRLVQTPQVFQGDQLLQAFQQTYMEAFTDEATVVETAGHALFLVDGEFENIKITRPADLILATEILRSRQNRPA